MKNIYRYLILIGLFWLSLSIVLNAQSCETEVAEEVETEESEISAEIGEEGGVEMTVEGTDVLGSEVGGEIGSELGAELTTELGAELLADMALDVIPVVGEVIATVGALYIAGEMIYELIKSSHDEKVREHKLAGDYKLPLLPEFSIAVEDLSGKNDTLTALFYLKKEIDSSATRQHLISRKQTEHIGKNYSTEKMSDALPYAFSNFDSYIKGQQTTIHQHYVRSISTLNFTVSSAVSNNLLVTIPSHWYHKNEEGEVSTLNLTSENTPVRLVLAKFDPAVHGGFVELVNIPFTAEQVNDHVAIRIREFGFKDHAGQPLFVLVKGNAYTEWGRNSNNTGTLFPTTSGASPPVIKERILARFCLRDYQRRDTKTSVLGKPAMLNGVSVINPFPILYTSEKTVYGGQSIREAEENKSNVILGVPIKNDWKRIKYIELQVSGGATALVGFNPELGPNDIIFRKPKAYYNNANSKENFIQINLLDVENPSTPKILEERDYFVKNTTKGDTIYWLLRNVPIKAGDVVAINTHYDEDLSYTRKTIKVSLGGTKNRAYYTIAKQGTANGYLRFTANVGETEPVYGVKPDPNGLYPQSDKWLIDHVTDNLYVIMHYNTRKVLAAKGNKVIMVPYNQFDENHHWAIKAVEPDAYALINVGSTILAITNTEIVLLNNENSALFTLTEIEAAPPNTESQKFSITQQVRSSGISKR